jgi:glutathionylspermidine synthase
MERHLTAERGDWLHQCKAIGFTFHHWNDEKPYWGEGIYYTFTEDEVDEIAAATSELHALCLEAVEHILAKERLIELGIPAQFYPMIYRSWAADEEGIYGRFDLRYGGQGQGAPKMFEYNADNPVTLIESAVAQWEWMEQVFPKLDQFNRVHEALIENWARLLPKLGPRLYFGHMRDSDEDRDTVIYLADTAQQGGFEVELIDMEDIGLDHGRWQFVDSQGREIHSIFKLYPWEWMLNETFSPFLVHSRTRWIEPPWKLVLSGKGILPILWELFPNHPNLLPASFDRATLAENGNVVRKPIFSRDGEDVTLYAGHIPEHQSHIRTNSSRYVFQRRQDPPKFQGHYPIIGSWMIGDEAAGIGIRENETPITNNNYIYVPHVIE